MHFLPKKTKSNALPICPLSWGSDSGSACLEISGLGMARHGDVDKGQGFSTVAQPPVALETAARSVSSIKKCSEALTLGQRGGPVQSRRCLHMSGAFGIFAWTFAGVFFAFEAF